MWFAHRRRRTRPDLAALDRLSETIARAVALIEERVASVPDTPRQRPQGELVIRRETRWPEPEPRPRVGARARAASPRSGRSPRRQRPRSSRSPWRPPARECAVAAERVRPVRADSYRLPARCAGRHRAEARRAPARGRGLVSRPPAGALAAAGRPAALRLPRAASGYAGVSGAARAGADHAPGCRPAGDTAAAPGSRRSRAGFDRQPGRWEAAAAPLRNFTPDAGSYLASLGGPLPYMTRLREIAALTERHERELAEAYEHDRRELGRAGGASTSPRSTT